MNKDNKIKYKKYGVIQEETRKGSRNIRNHMGKKERNIKIVDLKTQYESLY